MASYTTVAPPFVCAIMPHDDADPVAYALIVPPRKEIPEGSRYEYWLKLATVALREEQARIKEKLRPQIENYRRIKKSARNDRAV